MDDYKGDAIPSEQDLNPDNCLSVMVHDILDTGDALCKVNIGPCNFDVEFPNEVIEHLGVKNEDRFYWYPQEREAILPDDCYLEPVILPPPDLDQSIDDLFEKVLPYMKLD